MRNNKLLYVFSFIFILFIGLSEQGFAQEKGNIQKGLATWYGSKYHGRKTSSGEVYNKNTMTAAHPSLPFGTKVKVTNPNNEKSVIVRINDRGPFGKRGCIIDLSEAAARKMGIIPNGSGQVQVEILSVPGNEATEDVLVKETTLTADSVAALASPLPYFVIQAGAFSEQANAKSQSEKLKSLDQNLPIILSEELVNGRKIHRVEAGRFMNRAEAEQYKSRLKKKGIVVMVKQVQAAS